MVKENLQGDILNLAGFARQTILKREYVKNPAITNDDKASSISWWPPFTRINSINPLEQKNSSRMHSLDSSAHPQMLCFWDLFWCVTGLVWAQQKCLSSALESKEPPNSSARKIGTRAPADSLTSSYPASNKLNMVGLWKMASPKNLSVWDKEQGIWATNMLCCGKSSRQTILPKLRLQLPCLCYTLCHQHIDAAQTGLAWPMDVHGTRVMV